MSERLTAKDATHYRCWACGEEHLVTHWPSVGEEGPDCDSCFDGPCKWLKIEELSELPKDDEDVRDRRPWGGRIERVQEIGG